MPNLIRHLFGYMPVNIVSGLVSFGGVFIFTRLLGADDYGRYALAFSSLHLIHTLTLTWCEAAGYRFTAEAEAQQRLPGHFRTSLILAIVSLVPALTVLGLVMAMLHAAPEFRAALIWLVVLLPASVFINLALESHRASERVTRYSAVEIGRTLGGFILGVLLAWLGGYGAAAPLIGMAVAFAIAAVTEGIWLLRNSAGGKVERANVRRYVVYGVPVAMALILDLILSASDRFLIAYFIDEAAVGAYAAGYGVADKTTLMICAWAAMAGSPLVMKAYEQHGRSEAERQARGLAQALILVAVPAAVGLAIVAGPLSEVMIGEVLRDQASQIIPWIAFAGLFNGFLIHYFSEAFQLARKTAERALIMIFPAALNIGLNVWLLPTIGLMGAVYATVGCYVLAVVLLAAFGRRHIAMPIPVSDLFKVAVASLAMVGSVQLIPSFIPLLELMTKAGAGAIVYALVVVSLNAAGARNMAGLLWAKVTARLKTRESAESSLN